MSSDRRPYTHMLGLPKVEKLLGGDSERIIVYIEYHLPLTPKFILLEQSLREDGTKRKLYLFHVLLIIARKMITLSWLKPLPPTILQWQERVKRVYIMEKTTVHLHLKMDISKLLNSPVWNTVKMCCLRRTVWVYLWFVQRNIRNDPMSLNCLPNCYWFNCLFFNNWLFKST